MSINEVVNYLKKCDTSEKVKTYLNYISKYIEDTEDVKGRAYHIYSEDIKNMKSDLMDLKLLLTQDLGFAKEKLDEVQKILLIVGKFLNSISTENAINYTELMNDKEYDTLIEVRDMFRNYESQSNL